MGFTSAWSISGHEDSVIGELAPRVAVAIEADRDRPEARRRWARWQSAPLPDHRTWWTGTTHDDAIRSFLELTSPGRHVDDLCNGSSDPDFHLADDVWERLPEPEAMFVSVQRKDYAVAALFHAIGPWRAALLPGWCGNFLLTMRPSTTGAAAGGARAGVHAGGAGAGSGAGAALAGPTRRRGERPRRAAASLARGRAGRARAVWGRIPRDVSRVSAGGPDRPRPPP